MKKLIFVSILFSLLSAQAAWAQKTITIRGVATDSKGVPILDGDKTITFNVYDSPDANSPLWSEQQIVVLKDGMFTASLGGVNPLDLDSEKKYWLGMKIGDEEEMTPRMQLNIAGENATASVSGQTSSKTTAGPGGSNVGLDAAYDLGRIITADDGPVNIIGITQSTKFRLPSGGFWTEDANSNFTFRTASNKHMIFDFDRTLQFRRTTGFPTRFFIDITGNVGIGSTDPAAKLVVRSSSGTNLIEAYNDGGGAGPLVFRVERATGDVYAAGSFNPGGADVAEYVNTSEAVEPGDVIEIDPDNPGQFRKAREAKSSRVAGIITTDPGVILGGNSVDLQKYDNHPAVALAGRVPVKAMAKFGDIEIGDLLVSSPFPGYAMKCDEPRECIGAIIGKAMEPLQEGVGKIMVQVMLR